MSQTAPANPATQVAAAQTTRSARSHAAIADASRRTGVDFGYLLAQARIESGLDPNARARTSSATGLFQFIDQTWLSTMDRHGDELGFGQLAAAIDSSGGRARITDPTMRDAIMSLRFDPRASALMAGALASDNSAALSGVLGREPDASELYLAHFLGADGASRFFTTLGSDPAASAAGVLPAAARANRAIFYDQAGSARSVSDVMALVRDKVDTAMGQGFDLPPAAAFASAAPQAVRTPFALPALAALPVAQAGTASMTSTLEASFGPGGGDNPGLAHVRRAYARLSAMGL
jgi:hypothetical protein